MWNRQESFPMFKRTFQNSHFLLEPSWKRNNPSSQPTCTLYLQWKLPTSLTFPLHTCNGLFYSKSGWSERQQCFLRPALQGTSISNCSFLWCDIWQQFLLFYMQICCLPSSPAKKGPKMKAAVLQLFLPLAWQNRNVTRWPCVRKTKKN